MIKLTREVYIQTTYNMIVSEGLEQVSIRKIAKKLNCSSASLYRHFESLEHLMSFASIKFLQPYIDDLKFVVPKNEQEIDTYYRIWESFAMFSFLNPKIYNGIFFGQYSSNLSKTIKMYYTMFSSEITDIGDIISLFIMESNFNKRDLILLENCTKKEKFTKSDIQLISTLCVYLYKGMLKTVLEKVENESVEKLVYYLMDGIHFIVDSVKNKEKLHI